MIALMNYALPLMLLIGVLLFYKFKKLWILPATGILMMIYTISQPTYLPKGVVPQMKIEQLEQVTTPIVDRGRKVMSDEERDAARNKAIQEINDSINAEINKQGDK